MIKNTNNDSSKKKKKQSETPNEYLCIIYV